MIGERSNVTKLEAFNAPAHIGLVSLRVRDLAVVTAFYRDVLGLVANGTANSATLSAADGTALIKLIADPALKLAQPDAPGLFHTAFVLPTA